MDGKELDKEFCETIVKLGGRCWVGADPLFKDEKVFTHFYCHGVGNRKGRKCPIYSDDCMVPEAKKMAIDFLKSMENMEKNIKLIEGL